MKASAFNVRVPVSTGDVFLLNTLTDAQVVVSRDVVAFMDSLASGALAVPASTPEARNVIETLATNGFLVRYMASEGEALESRFAEFRDDTSQLRITILTTLQCNFACEYCYQGEHAEFGRPAEKMSLETAAQVAGWIARQVDEVQPSRLVLTFFGGEPLLNVPAMTDIAERCWRHTQSRRVSQHVNIITNGLLLSPELVGRMTPFGLSGIKITLDGDRETHDRMRPLCGGQGTFDRIIENVRRVAPMVDVTVGGNFDETTADRYPALLDFLKEQPFAPRITKIAFKPIIKPRAPNPPKAALALSPADSIRRPLNGSCMTAAGPSTGRSRGAAGGTACDNCHFIDDTMSSLREETRRRGFPTSDGVHMGPCELYRRHSHTIGPDGSLYGCPGFTGEYALSVGNIDGTRNAEQAAAAHRFERLAPWRRCGDCPFIPVCGGGCAVASHAELGDMDAPSCHKRSFESALVSLAEEAAREPAGEVQ